MKQCDMCYENHNNKMFCSNDCRLAWLHNYLKHNNAIFWNKEFQKEMSRRGASKAGRISNMINKKNKTGIYGFTLKKREEIVKEAHRIMKQKNVGFYNIDFARKQALLSQKVLRKQIRNLKFNNQYYDSKPEIEISLCLQSQFNYKPDEDKTLHIRVGRFEYDYLIKMLRLFIEYHPWDLKYSNSEYCTRRKQNLNNNGYKDYQLMVIT